MKWISDDKTMMVDLSNVDFYHYDEHTNTLSLSVRGREVVLRAHYARDLYKKLTTQKEVI